MITVIAAGVICVIAALSNISLAAVDTYLLLLTAFTVGVSSRITVQIPRFKSRVSVSDTFIFLTLLLYGGDFAVLLAAAEATAAAWRFCNRKITVFFNAATMALSTSLIVLVLNLSGLYNGSRMQVAPDGEGFLLVLLLIPLTQFLANTTLATIHDVLKDRVPLIETWRGKYIWTFFTYFAGAIGAGLLVQISDLFGLGILFAAPPVTMFVYLTYRMYLKNVEISVQQALQAEEYARILESQSDALRKSEERFRSAFDHAPIGIGLVNPMGSWLRVNRALSEILGYREEEFLASNFQSVTLPDDLGAALLSVHDLLSGSNANCQLEIRCMHKTGRIVWTAWSVSAANDTFDGKPNLIFQIQDITDKKIAEEKLQHEANHDALTGLPNRLYFMNRLDKALHRSRLAPDHRVSVLFIDIDRFKHVNDSLGHIVGDELLRGIASRLRDCMRPTDVVARLGGDEFTILVQGDHDVREVLQIAERVHDKFSLPFNPDGHELFSSASIGILHASDDHSSPEDVMRDADTAMYQAKRAGKARHEIFDAKMHNAAKETLKLETDLRRALERDEIKVVYQPIFDLETGRIVCFESLARWEHPEFGTILPGKFIPLAEELGLIDSLCDLVLSRACDEIGSLGEQSEGRPYDLSVNLSCRQFGRHNLVPGILNTLQRTQFPPGSLKLEITESVFLEHQERAVAMLNDLRQCGVRIDIDDFGTGYSNLGYLKKLPVSSLKIDRSFVSMIDADGNHDEIVRAIITLARNLGLAVIAEGIETERQLELLRELKCESGQGFLLAEPMSFATIRTLPQLDFATDLQPAVPDDISSITTIQ